MRQLAWVLSLLAIGVSSPVWARNLQIACVGADNLEDPAARAEGSLFVIDGDDEPVSTQLVHGWLSVTIGDGIPIFDRRFRVAGSYLASGPENGQADLSEVPAFEPTAMLSEIHLDFGGFKNSFVTYRGERYPMTCFAEH